MERLTGQAWKATVESRIGGPEASRWSALVASLLHLWQELEPLERLWTFTTLSEFYKDFRRSPGQKFVEFDMHFRAQLK